MGSELFTSAGSHGWLCPVGVTSITVECWGPGGDGADGVHIASPIEAFIAGGGGGGGAYALKTVAVTPGNTYNLIVGAHGSTTPTSFEASCIADYGRSGTQGQENGAGDISLGGGGAGGQAPASTGDVVTAGFSGAAGSFGPGGYGGLSPNGGQPGLGGRTGGDTQYDGYPGENPGSGGGAGGAGADEFAVFHVGFGADGADGAVLIAWETTEAGGIGSQEAFGTPTILMAAVAVILPTGAYITVTMATDGRNVIYPNSGDTYGAWLPVMFAQISTGAFTRELTGEDRPDALPDVAFVLYALVTDGRNVIYPDSGETYGEYGLQLRFVLLDQEQTDAVGIASEEAFGRPFISAVASISPDGIGTGEAFGALTLVPRITVTPVGIVSGEAFGTPEAIPGNVDVSPPSIASEEAFGVVSLFQSVMPRFVIGGRDRTAYLHHESDYSWNLMRGSRGSCSIPLVVEPGDEFAPQAGELIEIFDPVDVRVWAGTVEQIFVRWFGDAGWHLYVLTGVSLESLFDTVFVDKTVFDGVDGGDAFSDLYTASGVTVVALGTVETGETITALEVTRIADGFSSIALRSNLIWYVDPSDLTLNLVSALAIAAPWVMESEDMLWESMQWRQSRADFRDTQVIQAPDGSGQTIIAVTPNESVGRRTARLTLTTSNTDPGAIQEATAVLRRYSTLPSQLVVSTDRPGVSMGMLLEIDVDEPLESSGLLNGFWQVVEVQARMLTGMDRVDVVLRRLPTDLQLGHFRYTLHLVNSLAMAIFQGDGVTTVFTLPVTPGAITAIRVSPNGGLYATSSLGADVTITPAMPPGTHALVDYTGEATPDTGSFLDTWKGMSPEAASAGPTSSSGGGTTQRYIADATLRDLTIGDDVGQHAIVYHDGTGTRVLFVLRQVLGADLVLRFNLNGTPLVTLVVDSGTAVDDVLEFPLSARRFTVTIASPGVVTLEDATLADDAAVILHTTGALPTGLLADTTYYVVNSAGGTFELAATIGGASIDTSGTQSGSHWLSSTAIAAPAFADKDVLTYDILDSDEAIDAAGFANATLEWE